MRVVLQCAGKGQYAPMHFTINYTGVLEENGDQHSCHAQDLCSRLLLFGEGHE